MRILVTGAAGFIGSALVLKLLKRGDCVIGVDNFCDYYDPTLKKARLKRHYDYLDYHNEYADIKDIISMEKMFVQFQPQRVVNLAAQAGVRYSLINPDAYIESNLVGFANILECCRHNQIEHLVYASSSSVYGGNTHLPYSESDNVDHPLSLYAATKKANELMAHAYSHLYCLPTTGLRFFTVYGPWGRPDMAPMLFAKAILEEKQINVFNYGNMIRDFTFIDDIVEGIIRVIDKPAKSDPDFDAETPNPCTSNAPYRVFNIGNSKPIKLNQFIETLEDALGKKAKKKYLPIQSGDVVETIANPTELYNWVKFKPRTNLNEGITDFVKWYKNYYKK